MPTTMAPAGGDDLTPTAPTASGAWARAMAGGATAVTLAAWQRIENGGG